MNWAQVGHTQGTATERGKTRPGGEDSTGRAHRKEETTVKKKGGGTVEHEKQVLGAQAQGKKNGHS